MSVELFFLINGAADFSILSAVSRGFGAFRPGRIALASALCAVYAAAAGAWPPLRMPACQAALLLPLAMLTVGRASLPLALPCAAAIAGAAWVTGACARGAGSLWAACLLAAPVACMAQIRLQRRALSALPAAIEVVNRGAVARFPAWVDTGNRLTEPFSGQPVLIAPAPLLRRVLPPSGYRQVAYGSVGGGGTLKCFRPEKIYIASPGRRRRAPDAWIAVLPHRLPGAAQALAPAEFLWY